MGSAPRSRDGHRGRRFIFRVVHGLVGPLRNDFPAPGPGKSAVTVGGGSARSFSKL